VPRGGQHHLDSPANVDVVEPGDEIDVLMLDWSRGEELGSYLSES